MSNEITKPSKKKRTLIVSFAMLLIVASFFVWWMSFSSFKSSYKEIKQQYYSVVAGQVVNELESSINYGKSLDSFYNINGIFSKLTTLLPEYIQAGIINKEGEVLYTSFVREEHQDIMRVMENDKVKLRLQNKVITGKYSAFEQENQDLML